MEPTGPDQIHTTSPPTSTRSLTNPKSHSRSTNGSEQEPTSDDTHLKYDRQLEANDLIHDTSQPKSPLLTSHRLSTTSLDNVNLGEDVDPRTVTSKGRNTRQGCSLAECIMKQLLMAQLY